MVRGAINLVRLDGVYAVVKLPRDLSLSDLFTPELIHSPFWTLTRTEDELSLVCLQSIAPTHCPSEKDWRILKVLGPLEFSLTGILASLTEPLARAKISIFAISTFETDYLLVKESKIHESFEALKDAGFGFKI